MRKEEHIFNYVVDQFADLQVLRYRVAGFDSLTLQQKKLVYYLSEAALQGRDILFDQNGKYNLQIRLCWKPCMYISQETVRKSLSWLWKSI